MSNRFLGILIIIGFIGAGYLYYHLIYIPEQKIEIEKKLEFEKQLLEEAKEPQLVVKTIEEVKLTNAQKIEEIKEKNRKYKTFKLFNNLNAYFINKSNKIYLYLEDKKVGKFNLVYKKYLRVDLVLGTEKDLYIEVGADKFYYNHNTKSLSNIDLNIDVEYVKTGKNNKIIFVTSKGSFIYYTYDNLLQYFSYFKDFVYLNDGYLGLVRKEDLRILNNLGFKTDKNLVVYYNSDTKEKKIIYETDLEIDKIYVYNDKFYLVTVDGEIFELENI